ncbi:FAD-dependent oxidoreductase [Mastigocoleus testarum]|uniref:FAD-binding monooxygenase n=1 Tax=Mastigocoleus testarum BC008 TaxID=371196 RepID=A0A0V7ZJ01_9CYAN|nr:NAD(P)/FAD-dependent oxidoreductase [Mastigocoleus testarum]KST64417.1 FAD-binding monooxygenase [Mastigocoleus testarum BC008]
MVTNNNSPELQQTLIVGGGPAGFATALMLAKRGWKNITVLEKRPDADYYEPDKSFNYLIDGRGQKFTDYIGITENLIENGVPNTEFYLTEIKANGNRKTLKVPLADSDCKTSYWVTRKTFVSLLYSEIEKNWQESITVIFNAKCVEISKILADEGESEKLKVTAEIKNGESLIFEPFLLVGCDGINSIVRNTLKQWDKSSSNRFEMNYFPSGSAGLRYKVLTLPPRFPLDENGNELTTSEMSYAVRSAFKDPKTKISLGLLPLKNPDEYRSANIITKPNHKIWELKNGEEMYDFFKKSFPQIPIDKIISLQEVQRFAASEGGSFPSPQYCCGFYSKLNHEKAFIVLLGDAIHSFPPDLGQGVNSALEDVCILNDALESNDNNLSNALEQYESLRLPDVKALIRLMQIGYPWQYNQAPIRKKLWNINVILRLLLSKALPSILSPQAVFLIRNQKISYQEILLREQRTTKILYVSILMLVLAFLVFGLRNLTI